MKRQRHTERERERDRKRQRQRERQRDGDKERSGVCSAVGQLARRQESESPEWGCISVRGRATGSGGQVDPPGLPLGASCVLSSQFHFPFLNSIILLNDQ